MKTKLTHKLWAKILALVLLAASALALVASGFGVVCCIEYGIYQGRSFYESYLCDNDATDLTWNAADTYWYQGKEEAQKLLDRWSGQTNAYVRIVDSVTGDVIAASSIPDAVRERGLDQMDYYRGADGFAETYVYDYWSHEGAAPDVDGDFSIIFAVAAPLKDLVFDGFYTDSLNFARLQNLAYPLLPAAAGSALLLLALLSFLLCAAGHRAGTDEIVLNPVDKMPLDLYAALCVAVWCFGIALGDNFGDAVMFLIGIAAGLVLTIAFLLSFATRCKAGGVWKNTVIWRLWKLFVRACKAVGRVLRKGYGALPMIWKAVLVILAVCFMEVILLAGTLNDSGFWFLLFVLFNLALFLAACFGVWQMTMLKKAGKALASGDFDYKLDTSKMYWEFRSHGENLNSIATGMAIAVNQKMKSERLKTELITNVSHDIKTPLTSIVSYVDLLRRPESTEAERAEYLEVLARQSARLKKLTEDLVEASKASTGNIQVNLVPTSVEEIVNQAVAEYAERLEAGRLEPIVHLSDRSLSALADGRLLWRVLDNLLNNVGKYALAGTRVYLDAKAEGETVVISVKNVSRDPLNVSEEELMERFVRGDASRTTEGSGLGLNIAKSLTELQRGTFRITIDGDLFKAEITLSRA